MAGALLGIAIAQAVWFHLAIEKGDTVKIYDLLWKRTEDRNGKARWEKVGVLMDKDDGKKSIKLDLVPQAAGTAGWS